MSKTGYSVPTGAAVGLAAATAKSVLGINGHANFGVDLRRFKLGYDGVTASAIPVLVELCYATFATNVPGTNSTSVTPGQAYGRVTAPGFVGGYNWTTEPTVLSVLDSWLLTPNGGLVFAELPEGLDSAPAQGFVIRCTAPAIVNVRGTLWAERA